MKKWFRKCKSCGKEGNYQRPFHAVNYWYLVERCKYCLAPTLDIGEEKEINLVTGKIVEDNSSGTN